MKKLIIAVLIAGTIAPAAFGMLKPAAKPIVIKQPERTISKVMVDSNQVEFINALADGNVAKVSQIINAPGFDPNKPFTISGFNGQTPLSVTLRDKIPSYKVQNNTLQLVGLRDTASPQNKNRILELLVAKGLDVKQVIGSLHEAINAKDDIKALWLIKLSKSIFDKKPQINKEWIATFERLTIQAKRLSETESVARKIIWTQVYSDLEKLTQQLAEKK